MENNNNGSKLLGRRRALQMFGVGAAGVAVLAACGNKKETPQGSSSGTAEAPSCDSTPDDNSKQMRKTLQYKKEAVDPAKHCSACAQYDPGKFGECGACKLFGGPVRPNGGCLSFAPKEAGAAVPN